MESMCNPTSPLLTTVGTPSKFFILNRFVDHIRLKLNVDHINFNINSTFFYNKTVCNTWKKFGFQYPKVHSIWNNRCTVSTNCDTIVNTTLPIYQRWDFTHSHREFHSEQSWWAFQILKGLHHHDSRQQQTQRWNCILLHVKLLHRSNKASVCKYKLGQVSADRLVKLQSTRGTGTPHKYTWIYFQCSLIIWKPCTQVPVHAKRLIETRRLVIDL